MSRFALFVAMLAPAIFVAAALAQTQLPPPAGRSSPPPGATTPAPEAGNAVEGRIENIDPSRTAITLSDGTKLVTPAGAVLTPGVVTEDMLVVASYRQENGAKVLTGLTVKDRGQATRLNGTEEFVSRDLTKARRSARRRVFVVASADSGLRSGLSRQFRVVSDCLPSGPPGDASRRRALMASGAHQIDHPCGTVTLNETILREKARRLGAVARNAQ